MSACTVCASRHGSLRLLNALNPIFTEHNAFEFDVVKSKFEVFPTMFSTLTEREIVIVAKLNLLPTNAFNLVMLNFERHLKRKVLNILLEKQKMLLTSIFSFSHNLFFSYFFICKLDHVVW